MSVLSNDRIQGPLSTFLCRFESDMVLAQEFDRSGDEEREGRKEGHRGRRVRRRAEKGRDGKRHQDQAGDSRVRHGTRPGDMRTGPH